VPELPSGASLATRHARWAIARFASKGLQGLVGAALIFLSSSVNITLADEVESEEISIEDFDLWDGIDRNGRISKVEKPADLPNPERWRYIPPGRMPPGNAWDRLGVSTFFIPIVFRDGDVGTGFGAGFVDVDFRNTNRQEFLGVFGSYSTKGQQSYNLVWRRWLRQVEMPDGGVFQEERNLVNGRFGYSKSLTRRFYGIGPDTEESDETRYTDGRFIVNLGTQITLPHVGSDWVWAFGALGEFHKLSDGVGGVSNTSDDFPILFAEADDTNLGWIYTSLSWDTRDSIVNPYRGSIIGASMDGAFLQTDWKVGAIFKIFASKVFAVPGLFHRGGDANEENPPTDTLSFKFKVTQLAGSVPFYSLPSLGGSEDLKGFIDGRFRDKASWIVGAEYRLWVIPRGFRIPLTRAFRVERVGLAGFYEAGSVANDVGAFFEERVLQSYGMAFLVTLDRTAPFRINLGWSEDGLNVSAGFGLDF
jgi:hypothetical protein